MTDSAPIDRQAAVAELKQSLILDAARAVFEEDGIDGASIRAIAKRAGYTPGAIYFHFASKEDIYAALLDRGLDAILAHVEAAVSGTETPTRRLHAAAHGFFGFYAENPRELDLGFYLFRGGMRPHGVGRERDRQLNEKLLAALAPFRNALRDMGCDAARADAETASFFAHASGLLLLHQTGRMRLFPNAEPRARMDAYLEDLERRVERALAHEQWRAEQDPHES